MKLLILGDLAITNENECQESWSPPLPDYPNEQNRILVNWEFAIGTQLNPDPRKSGKRYLSHPMSPYTLKHWAPGFATLATNHMLDARAEGLELTIKMLHTNGFTTVGAGSTDNEISSPLIWETNEGRLSIINWVFPETHPDWNTIPGVNCWPGLDEAGKTIRRIKTNTDWLLLILHWSDELFAYPRPDERILAEALAVTGVDGIICHHPHVVRGKEIFKSIPVFYSIGNLYFSEFYDSKTNNVEKHAPRNRESLGVQISFKANSKPVFDTFSFWQQDISYVKDNHQRAEKQMRKVSKPLEKFSGKSYENWYNAERNRFQIWGAKWDFVIKRLGLRGLIRYFFQRTFKNTPSV